MKERQMKIIDGCPTAAIYARKSKATEKGESIENQISRCISLCELRGWGYVVFQDYDVSGATLDRPDFELMMKEIYQGKYQYLVCYKLDRVSRSTSDFSNLINELDSINVPFISIKENFDLTTPMGRAMMMITAVFAQLERETIAERVRDNMIDRAKLGKWNGGPIPFGFDVEKKTIEYKGHNKKISKLVINKEESETIKKFYEWYLAPGGSIRNVVTKANELGYKTKNNAHWSHNQVSRMLQNPLYCIADEDSYNYFKDHTEVNIVDNKEDYNGTHGLMYYNRRKPHKKTTRERDEDEWILAIGEHEGFIPGEIFARVQFKLDKNKRKAPRSGQSERSPLAGLVRCGRCGAAMSVFSSPRDSSNKQKGYYHYFRCITREQKSKILCDNSNVRADILEDLVLSHIVGLVNNKKSLESILEATNNDIEDRRIPLIAKRNKLQSELDNLDIEINNLVDALGKNILPELVIKRKYKELENKKIELRNELEKINIELNNNYVESYDLDTVIKHIENFKYTYEYLDLDEKKKLLRSIIKEIEINRNKVKLTLYFLPGKDFQDLDSQADCLRTDMDALAKSKTLTIECPIYNVETLPENTLGERVYKLRNLTNTTIKDLGKLCNLAPETISNIEKSRTNPNITTLSRLSQALGTTNKYLLNADSWPENTPGQIIYKYRMIAGLSQRQLAKKCGLHYSTIKDYEADKILNPDTLEIIYKAIDYYKK